MVKNILILFCLHFFISGYIPKLLNAMPTVDNKLNCKYERVLSLTLDNGDRLLAGCNDGACKDVEVISVFSAKELLLLNKYFEASNDQKNQSVASTLFGISNQQASYMIQSGVDAKVLMVGEYKTIIGDKTETDLKSAKYAVDNTKIFENLRGKGESWRECDALPSLRGALGEIVKDVNKRGNQFDRNELRFVSGKLNHTMAAIGKSMLATQVTGTLKVTPAPKESVVK